LFAVLGRQAVSRVKLFAEEQIKVMHRQRELAIGVGDLLVQGGCFQPTGGPFETDVQGNILIGITQGAQQTPNFLRSLARIADDGQSRGHWGASGGDALEQEALELPAIFRPLRVNTTSAPVQCRTRLAEKGSSGGGAWTAGFGLQY
jgi:hypothetical protein